MNSPRTFCLLLILLIVFCFGLATHLQPQFRAVEIAQKQSDNFFAQLLGNSSKIFANAFFVEADAYYHSGFYPTIFDNNSGFQTAHMAADTGAIASHNQGDEDTSFMGPPRDWIDAFGRHFIPNRHSHLDEGGAAGDLSGSVEVREILPWLKLSAELDPNDIKTYVVTAFWLRTKLNQVSDAEEFLRDGLRQNPQNPQLLFELGRIYFESRHEIPRARNIWEAALRSWAQEKPGVPQSERLKLDNENFDDRFIYEQLQTSLANLEQAAGNYQAAIERWKLVAIASPNPAEMQRHIDDLNQKIAAQKNTHSASDH